MGSFNQAVFYYLKTNSVLKKYSYIPSFKSILVECEAIIASLKDALLNQARSTVNSTLERSPYIRIPSGVARRHRGSNRSITGSEGATKRYETRFSFSVRFF